MLEQETVASLPLLNNRMPALHEKSKCKLLLEICLRLDEPWALGDAHRLFAGLSAKCRNVMIALGALRPPVFFSAARKRCLRLARSDRWRRAITSGISSRDAPEAHEADGDDRREVLHPHLSGMFGVCPIRAHLAVSIVVREMEARSRANPRPL